MYLITQASLAGITNGMVYALIGMGLAAIFKGSRVVNAMQGEFSVVAAILAAIAMAGMGAPYWLAAMAGIAAAVLIGVFIELVFIRYMIRKGASPESFLLLTVGIALTISAALLFFAGRSPFLLPPLGGEDVFLIMDAVLSLHALWLISLAILITFLLRLFFRKTVLGLRMMAASIDAEGAITTGINVALMRTYTFALGGLLGGVAGILITPLVPVNYHVGLALTLKGFAAAILGGLTNPLGAAIGGLTLGLIEALTVVAIPSAYKDVITFTLLIFIMILMPDGMLGRRSRKGG